MAAHSFKAALRGCFRKQSFSPLTASPPPSIVPRSPGAPHALSAASSATPPAPSECLPYSSGYLIGRVISLSAPSRPQAPSSLLSPPTSVHLCPSASLAHTQAHSVSLLLQVILLQASEVWNHHVRQSFFRVQYEASVRISIRICARLSSNTLCMNVCT